MKNAGEEERKKVGKNHRKELDERFVSERGAYPNISGFTKGQAGWSKPSMWRKC